MDNLKFDGDTLGQRHRNYNKFLAERPDSHTKEILSEIDVNGDDVHNLCRVDVACRNSDVEYILKVLKGNDLLYVSRAIKLCDWLITDNQYAHIINPKYLTAQLFPLMMAKAFNKLILSIRLNLRDEHRVEDFFNHYENLDLRTALKWLPHCSTGFIESKVDKHFNNIEPTLLSRLCEKTANALKIMADKPQYRPFGLSHEYFYKTMFLLNTHMDLFLGLIESYKNYSYPKFNSKHTNLIMTHRPQRIYQNFSKYANSIHIPTFVNFINPNEIKGFLINQAKQENKSMGWLNYNNLQYFLKRMPLEERMPFINETLSENKKDPVRPEIIKLSETRGFSIIHNNDRFLFTPFDTAMLEIKEKIKLTTDAAEKHQLLRYLPQIVGNNPQQLEELLKYYNENFLKEKIDFIIQFTNQLCLCTDFLKYNVRCWNLLDEIFVSIKLYDEGFERSKSNNENISVQAIIIHKVINKQKVPDTLKEHIDFDILNKFYKNRLILGDKEQLFAFLYDHLLQKIESSDFKNPILFADNNNLLRLMLTFLNDWQKNLVDCPNVLSKIRDLVHIQKELKENLSWIYDVNKTWRKCMFEQSISLCPSQKVCMNALKHDPSLLTRYDEEVTQLRCKDTISLKPLLYKLKIYWPESLATEWAQSYRSRLEEPVGHKALMRGLSCLLPRSDMINLINQYKPTSAKIDWVEDNETALSLTKHLAKNMHYARPQPDPDMILQYAKGDYLQYALPSLQAILHNLCTARCCELVPRLLDAPVSLQKHGIRLAFSKMQSEDLQQTFGNYWKTVQNVSIRAVMFKRTHELLCKEKNPEKINNIWELLSVFIDGLTFVEDKTIYQLLSEVGSIPHQVLPLYVVKSYKFLKSLLPESGEEKSNYERSLNYLLHVITDLIESESIDPDFVEDLLLDYNAAVYTTEKTNMFDQITPLMVSYVLYTKNKEEQIRRYESVLVPVLKHAFAVWENQENSKIHNDFESIWNYLRDKCRDAVKRDMTIPVAIFTDILSKLEASSSHIKHYLLLRQLKMFAAFMTTLNEKQPTAVEMSRWNYVDMCEKSIPEFSNICVNFLKDDVKLYFPCIYEYFSKALGIVMDRLFNQKLQLQFLNHLLTEDLIETYLLTIYIMPSHSGCDDMRNYIDQLRQKVLSHPSLEVKMHFYHKNKIVSCRI